MRRKRVATVLAIAVGTTLLSGCFDGFDPHMTHECIATWRHALWHD